MGPTDWEAWLADRLQRTVEVRYGRSRTKPLAIEDGADLLKVRMHRFFAAAPDDVRESMARWITAGRRARKACVRLDGWIDARLAELPLPAQRIQTNGRAHDLAPMAALLFAAEFRLDFQARPPPAVTWGRRARSSARRTILLGSYRTAGHIVRIHPVLDQKLVPDWYVRFILFHEILHAALPSGRVHHTPAFKKREQDYPDYARSRRWEKKHIERLIRSARKGQSHATPQKQQKSGQRFLFRF